MQGLLETSNERREVLRFHRFCLNKNMDPGVTSENFNSLIKFELFQVSVATWFQLGFASRCGSKFGDFVEIHLASGSPSRCRGFCDFLPFGLVASKVRCAHFPQEWCVEKSPWVCYWRLKLLWFQPQAGPVRRFFLDSVFGVFGRHGSCLHQNMAALETWIPMDWGREGDHTHGGTTGTSRKNPRQRWGTLDTFFCVQGQHTWTLSEALLCCEIISKESVVVQKKPGAFWIDRLCHQEMPVATKFFSSCEPPRIGKQEMRILMVGLDVSWSSAKSRKCSNLDKKSSVKRLGDSSNHLQVVLKKIWVVATQILVIFTPKTWENWTHFDHINIFQKGLVNQPPTRNPEKKTSTNIMGQWPWFVDSNHHPRQLVRLRFCTSWSWERLWPPFQPLASMLGISNQPQDVNS